MFAIIEVVRNEKSVLEKAILRLIPLQPELIKVAVKNGAPYFIIRVTDSKKIPWDDITYLVGRCSSNILVPNDTYVPKEVRSKCFTPTALPIVMLSNTVTDLFRNSKRKLSIGIVDRHAILAKRIFEYVGFSSEITVITDYPLRYDAISYEMNTRFGISVYISQEVKKTEKCDFVISEKAVDSTMCFCIDAQGKKNCIELFDFSLPPVYEQKIPKGVDRDLFSAALFELCGVRRIGELKFKKIKIGNTVLLTDEIKNRSVIIPTCLR